jgi:hypothetical protein
LEKKFLFILWKAMNNIKNNLAPIALFTYNRPIHTQRTLIALSQNIGFKKSPIYIFSDGPKNNEDILLINQTRNVIRKLNHPKKKIIFKKKNIGLSQSIINGINYVLKKHKRIIVLEDDLLTSPFFLEYMNNALEKYEDNIDIISINGFSFPIKNLPETFFLKDTGCWGWATWKKEWNYFENDAKKLLYLLKKNDLLYRFDLNGSYPYKKMLYKQINNKISSWAIRWRAVAILNNKLTLHPGKSLVVNIGFDGSGENCREFNGYNVSLTSSPIRLFPEDVNENSIVLKKLSNYFVEIKKKKILYYLKNFFKNLKYLIKK